LGASAAMQKLYHPFKRGGQQHHGSAAGGDGTAKVNRQRDRASAIAAVQPYICLNLFGVAGSLIESELFGGKRAHLPGPITHEPG